MLGSLFTVFFFFPFPPGFDQKSHLPVFFFFNVLYYVLVIVDMLKRFILLSCPGSVLFQQAVKSLTIHLDFMEDGFHITFKVLSLVSVQSLVLCTVFSSTQPF